MIDNSRRNRRVDAGYSRLTNNNQSGTPSVIRALATRCDLKRVDLKLQLLQLTGVVVVYAKLANSYPASWSPIRPNIKIALVLQKRGIIRAVIGP